MTEMYEIDDLNVSQTEYVLFLSLISSHRFPSPVSVLCVMLSFSRRVSHDTSSGSSEILLWSSSSTCGVGKGKRVDEVVILLQH